MNDVRIEEDLLGSREVPTDAYYGVHTVRAMENFKISSGKISDVPEMVRGMVMVKKASAMANKDMFTISAEIADAIIAGCDEVLVGGRCMDQFPIDVFQGGAGTSVNMNANEVIANLALEHMGLEKGRYDVVNPNEHVNESQSTNDAYPSGFRIALFTVVQGLKVELDNLAAAFDVKAEEFKDVMKMGRTQLQDAIPMTLGQEFKVYGVLMREEIRQLDRAAELLLEVNLGATAIGTGLNTPEGYAKLAVEKLAEVSGLPMVLAENLIEATSDAGAYVSMHAAIKRMAVKLGLKPRARFAGFDVIGDDPLMMLTAPIPATRRVLEKSGINQDAIDHFEVNEAFASVPLAWQREFNVDPAKLNPCGGAIALGHPLGASGARLMTTMLNAMERSGARYGLQTMCEAGGMANATILERV